MDNMIHISISMLLPIQHLHGKIGQIRINQPCSKSFWCSLPNSHHIGRCHIGYPTISIHKLCNRHYSHDVVVFFLGPISPKRMLIHKVMHLSRMVTL